MSVCASCNRTIRWVKTPAGKQMPVDMLPNPDGNVQIVQGVARVLKALQSPDRRLPRFTSHFQTCPEAGKHRRKKPNEAQPGKEMETPKRKPKPIQGSLF